MVEQRTVNARVVGSSPTCGANFFSNNLQPRLGETALWVECELYGRVFGGAGVEKVIVTVGNVNVCVDCLGQNKEQMGKLD